MGRRRSLRSLFISVLVVSWSLGVADATVTQVDGTIIPEGNNLQNELDAEGETLDAKLDAAELPEVFMPNTTQPVIFYDFAEGAGFENSFGWYNVGDDVLTPEGRRQNLHPIFGCGAEMQNHAYVPGHTDHHHGNPAFYVQDAEPDDQVSVDFAAEQAAGRYKGGFIGFYLITPEDVSGNCGDFVDGEAFGYIYFTQKDLNDDGDFVHHLVYTSGTDPDKFYFGFEDLFRGGDNDFEDMASWVKGLQPPCVPTAEVCDGLDNDCDGLVDNADPMDLQGVDMPCTCDGVAMTCADGVVFGECQGGLTVCLNAEIQCQSNVGPTAEVCDNLDNNCNNIVDDNPTDAGAPCDGPDSDLCQEGVEVCDMGVLVCDDNTGPNLEVCNGADDDCDGTPDNNLTDEGGVCGSDVGECESGTEVCNLTTGMLECQGETTPTPEVCDNLDNNCNGVVDDAPTDVGVQCGATDEGECEFGTTICNSGTLDCAGEVGPVPETCDTKDNDCNGMVDDNPVDVGQPCGSDVGVCEPGVTICTATGLVCDGETGGGPELCNRLDDDCNGIIDDNPTDVGGVCGDGTGVCEPGNLVCIDGAPQCIGGVTGGTETCNGLDDDCDGMTDEGELCEGGECNNGTCSAPCAPGEFPCPVGLVCRNNFCVTDPCFGIVCPPESNGDQNVCEGGSCVPVCNTVTCTGSLVCRPSDGACVPDTCEFRGGCADDELCKVDECVDNPCHEVDCPDGEFCRGGSCIKTCAGVDCLAGEECRDGVCQATGCTEDCTDGTVCDGSSGDCVADPCIGESCPKGEVCDPSSGDCIDDPCFGIECAEGEVCELGNCFDPPADMADAGPEGQYVYAAGGGGCAASTEGSTTWFWVILLSGAFAFGVGRRRSGKWRVGVWMLVLVMSMFFGSLSCSIDGFCINCATGGTDGDGGMAADASTAPDAEPADAGGPGCQDGVVFPEICDGFDNDCDGPVDEDFDLQTDRENCGECGTVCEKPGAIAVCQSGGCAIAGCFPGNVDLDGDATGPFDQSNGCEYKCFVSNGGVEACDDIDNDCDGDTDEDTDFMGDENNCGQCGKVCSFFAVTGATCTGGVCGFNPATDCDTGFFDINGTQADGCEYACTETNGGVEACDLRDNNCDGNVDETFDVTMDPANCGQCGNACAFPHATPTCMMGTCAFNPSTDCEAGFHDVNGDQLDGCEYACTITNGGVEACDTIDNDCDGIADNNVPTVGDACNNAPSGTATGDCTNTGTIACSTGTLVCVGAPEPTPETCDNRDNDCNGMTDDGVTRSCYTGTMGTLGIGECKAGTEQCVAGAFDGNCQGEVTPTGESCDNKDNDCDADVDEDMAGAPLTQTCYTGTVGTAGVGECVSGTQTCTFGVFGTCIGEVTDLPYDICGDGIDTDCDNLDDAQEGCLGTESEFRLDAPGGSNGTTPGEQHSFDVQLASGGSPLGSRVYATWSDLSNGASDIFFRRSIDGGVTWQSIINLTSGHDEASVKPLIVVAPGASNDTVFVVFQSVNNGVRDIRYVASTNSGSSFSGVSGRLDGGEDAFHHDAAISSNGQTVAVVWEALDTGSLERNIISRASTDGGSNFQSARTINVGSGGSPIAGRPQVGITNTGRFVFAWREVRSGSTTDIFTAFSDSADANIAGAAEERIDNDTGDTRDSDFPQLEVVDSNVYLVWQDISTQPGGGSDVVFARSTNGAASFGAEQIIDDPAGEVSSSFTPVMAVDPAGAGGSDDRVFLAWEDRRQGTQIYASRSTDGGASFSTAIRASNDTGATITGVTRRPSITYAGGDVVIVAYNNDLGLGTTTEHVFTTSTIDGGTTWSYTHQRIDGGAGKALSPVVTRSSGSGLVNAGVVAWTDFRSGSGINGDAYSRRAGQ